MTLKAGMNHIGMRKTGADPVNFAHIETDVRVEAVLHAARRRIVVFSLAVVVTGAGFRPRRRRLRGLRGGRRRLAVRVLSAHVLRVRQLVILLPFHTAVLEPDLDLPLGQDQSMSDLDPSSSRQVPIVVKLLLQLEYLMPRIGGSLSLRLHSGLERAVRCKGEANRDVLVSTERFAGSHFLFFLGEYYSLSSSLN